MKTRHVVAIGILTAIAVGLLAIGIKTHQKAKVQQTSAYYEYDSISGSRGNPNWTITGQPTTYNVSYYQENGLPTIPIFNYTIQKQNETLTYTNNITGIYYLDTNANPNEIKKSNALTNQTDTITINNVLQQIKLIEIYISDITFTNVGSTNNIDATFNIYFTKEDNTIYARRLLTSFRSIDPIFNDDVINENTRIDRIELSTAALNQYANYQYQTGYSTGYQTKGDLSDGNFLSIQETMLNVLTMPFTFISQGFNVTLWEGTPYQINIGNFIKSLIAIATILFIIKMFTSGFSVVGNYTSGTGANISQWRKNRSERKLNESKARLNDRTDPNHKSRSTKSDVTIHKE